MGANVISKLKLNVCMCILLTVFRNNAGPMAPFLNAARWIPLAVDPFITLHDVFLVGIKGRSGQRETMNK